MCLNVVGDRDDPDTPFLRRVASLCHPPIAVPLPSRLRWTFGWSRDPFWADDCPSCSSSPSQHLANDQGVTVTMTLLYRESGGVPLSVTRTMKWMVSAFSTFGAVTKIPSVSGAPMSISPFQEPASGYWNQ